MACSGTRRRCACVGSRERGAVLDGPMTASDRSVPLPAPRSPLPLEVQCTHRAPLRAESRRRMRLVLGISAAVMVAEAVGGYAAGSLALLADAGHVLTDVAAPGPAVVRG